MARVAEYKSEITASWIYGDKETKIEPSSITYILFNYDYDNANMPLAYMSLNLKTSLYNNMVEHMNDSKIFLDIKRFNVNAKEPVKATDVCEQFQYFLPSDKNRNQYLTNSATEHNQDETSYLHIVIGLIKSEVYDENKRAFDDMVFTGNLSTLVYRGLDHVKRLCINTVSSNIDLEDAEILPMSSVKEYLDYIDDNWGIYDYGFRYFHDYRTTYLLDEDPHYVPNGNSQYSSVHINILEDTDIAATTGGVTIDKDNSQYILNIGTSHCGFGSGKVMDVALTDKVSIDDEGNITSSPISSNRKASKKVVYDRGTSGSKATLFSINKYKVTLTISRPQLDGHLFTPNKQYFVKGHENDKDFDGQYALWQKRVVYQMKDGYMIPTTSLVLRKVVTQV